MRCARARRRAVRIVRARSARCTARTHTPTMPARQIPAMRNRRRHVRGSSSRIAASIMRSSIRQDVPTLAPGYASGRAGPATAVSANGHAPQDVHGWRTDQATSWHPSQYSQHHVRQGARILHAAPLLPPHPRGGCVTPMRPSLPPRSVHGAPCRRWSLMRGAQHQEAATDSLTPRPRSGRRARRTSFAGSATGSGNGSSQLATGRTDIPSARYAV